MAVQIVKKSVLAGCLGLMVALPHSATAQDKYPERTVEIINQFGPGGGTDMFIRAIGMPMTGITRQSIVGLSVTGGGGVPAYTEFMSRPADGHSLMAIGPEEVINHVLGRIDAEELRPVARVQWDQGLLYVRADSEFETAQDLIGHAKENPGTLTIGGTGAAGYDETVVALWGLRTDTEHVYVPFDSAAEAFSAVLGGHAQVLFEEFGPARALVEAGEIRPLVVFSEERLPDLPEVPTAQELGHDVNLGRWRGFALKQEDDPEHAKALFEVVEEAAEDPIYKNVEEQNALQYRSVVIGPDEFQEFLDSEIELYREVLGALGHL